MGHRRRGSRGVVLALLVIATCSACYNTPSTSHTGATSNTPSSQVDRQSQSGGSTAFRSVVDPPSSIPDAYLEGVKGAIIYKDWVHSGRVFHLDPDAMSSVPWTPVRISPSQTDLHATITTGVPTDQLTVTFFTRAASDGRPVGAGMTAVCSPIKTTPPGLGTCNYVRTTNRTTLVVRLPSMHTLLLLSADWYIPSIMKKGVLNAPASDSVRWAFRVTLS
jgi:hypothetical protein